MYDFDCSLSDLFLLVAVHIYMLMDEQKTYGSLQSSTLLSDREEDGPSYTCLESIQSYFSLAMLASKSP